MASAVLLIGAALSSGAWAQGARPIQLFQLPQEPSRPAAPPTEGRTGTGDQGIGLPGGDRLGNHQGGLGEPFGGVEVPEDLGLWSREDGGLGHGLWRGSRRETIAYLLDEVDGVYSPTLRTLALRVLLSEAETPGPSLRPLAADGAEQNLLLRRGEALLALGEPGYLGALMALVRSDAAGAPPVLKLKSQADLLVGEYGKACETAREGVVRDPQDAFWTKAQIACQAARDERDPALLGLDLLRESGEGVDEGFAELAHAALGYGKAPADPAPSALNIALVLGSELVPPQAWQDSRDPAVVAMAARDSNLEADRRLLLAERAADGGAVQPDELVGFYERKGFSGERVAEAATAAAELEGPQARALLYAAARAQPPGAARADLVRQAMARAREDGVEAGVARVFAPLVAEIQASAAMLEAAPAAARTLLLAGRYELAGAWIDELRRSADLDPAARQALAEIWPLARLAGVEVPGGPQDLAAWREARQTGTDAELHGLQVVTLRGLLYSLGESDALSFGELIGSEPTGSLTGTSTLLALEQAAAGGRLGETVLLVVTVVGENGVEGHPYATAKAVEALNRVGRPGEARALAMEAAVARGL